MPDLQTLINAIPVADDGHVITREYHNSLRDALVQLASQLGGGTISPNVTIAYPPHFTQNDAGPNWVMLNGIANKDQSGSADGWFAVQLPQGARIQNMTVTGRRAGAVVPFSIRLLRVNVADGEVLQIINISLSGASNPFSVTQTPNLPGAGPAAIEEARVVDNNNHTYLVTAIVRGATDIVQINGIKITYSRS